MKLLSLVACIFFLLTIDAQAQPPPIGYIGLYVDENHSANEVWNTGGIKEFTMYVFCLPGEHGMAAVEFAIDYPLNVYADTVIYSPDVVVALGKLDEGISLSLFGCWFEWKCVLQQKVYLLDTAPSRIAIAPHGTAGTYQFASCLEGFPLEPAYVASSICLNSSACEPDTVPPTLAGVTVPSLKRITAAFSEPLFQPLAEEKTNYELFESLSPAVTIAVTKAELLADRSSVMLYLGQPLEETVSYTLRVSGLKDVTGNEIAAGSETQFMGEDTIPPALVSATCRSDSEVVVTFDEPLSAASAETAANYCIGDGPPPLCGIVPASASLLDETSVLLRLSTKLSGPATYYLQAENVEDLAGNPLPAESHVTLSTPAFHPPRVLSTTALDKRHLEVVFNEALDLQTALRPANYRIFKALDTLTVVSVDSAAFYGSESVVRLVAHTDLEVGAPYFLRVCLVENTYNLPIVCPTDVGFVVPDVYPPLLVSARAPADTTAEVAFNERLDPATAESPGNYTIFETANPAAVIPVSAASLAGDSSLVRLFLADSLVDDLLYTVRVSSVEDTAGNAILAGSAISLVYPDTFPPRMTGVYPYNEMSVTACFNERVRATEAENGLTYRLSLAADTTQAIGVISVSLLPGNTAVRIAFAYRLTTGERYRLTARGIADVKGNAAPFLASEFVFLDLYAPWLVMAKARGTSNVDVLFSEPVDAATGMTQSNYEVFERGNPASSIPVTGAALRGDSSAVRLALGGMLDANLLYRLRASGVEDREHNAMAAGEIDIYPPDSIPPTIEAVRAADFRSVIVRFSEPVERESAEDTAHYVVYHSGSPTDVPKLAGASLLDDSVTVRLSLSRAVTLWWTYVVRVNGVIDLAVNQIAPGSEKSFVCSPLPENGAMGLFTDTQRSQSSVYVAGGQITEFTMYVFCLPSARGQREAEFAIRYPSNVTPGAVVVNDAAIVSSIGDLASGVDARLRGCNYDWVWTHKQTCYLLDGEKSTVGIVKHPGGGAYGFWSCAAGNPLEGVDILTHLYCNCTYNPGTRLSTWAAACQEDRIEISWSLSEIDEGVAFSVSRAEGAGTVFAPLPESGLAGDGSAFLFVDRDIRPGASYRYRVEFSDKTGAHVLFETEPIATPALPAALYQNVPNPFNPSTMIAYYVPETSKVVLEIYDVAGRRVARLVDGMVEHGRHEVRWNGMDDSGRPVTSGLYLCRMRTGKDLLSRKVVLLR